MFKLCTSETPVGADGFGSLFPDYCILETEQSRKRCHCRFYRSENSGQTGVKVNEERKLRQRAWYYGRIFPDPKEPDKVYATNVNFFRTDDVPAFNKFVKEQDIPAVSAKTSGAGTT